MYKKLCINGINFTDKVSNVTEIDYYDDVEVDFNLTVNSSNVREFDRNTKKENIIIIMYKEHKNDREPLKVIRVKGEISFRGTDEESFKNSVHFVYHFKGHIVPLDVREDDGGENNERD